MIVVTDATRRIFGAALRCSHTGCQQGGDPRQGERSSGPRHTTSHGAREASDKACVSRPLSGSLVVKKRRRALVGLALGEAVPTSLAQQRKVSKGRGNGERHPRKVWRPSMTNPLADLPSGQRASSAKSTVIPFLRKLLSPPVMPGGPVRGQKEKASLGHVRLRPRPIIDVSCVETEAGFHHTSPQLAWHISPLPKCGTLPPRRWRFMKVTRGDEGGGVVSPA